MSKNLISTSRPARSFMRSGVMTGASSVVAAVTVTDRARLARAR